MLTMEHEQRRLRENIELRSVEKSWNMRAMEFSKMRKIHGFALFTFDVSCIFIVCGVLLF